MILSIVNYIFAKKLNICCLLNKSVAFLYILNESSNLKVCRCIFDVLTNIYNITISQA